MELESITRELRPLLGGGGGGGGERELGVLLGGGGELGVLLGGGGRTRIFAWGGGGTDESVCGVTSLSGLINSQPRGLCET